MPTKALSAQPHRQGATGRVRIGDPSAKLHARSRANMAQRAGLPSRPKWKRPVSTGASSPLRMEAVPRSSAGFSRRSRKRSPPPAVNGTAPSCVWCVRKGPVTGARQHKGRRVRVACGSSSTCSPRSRACSDQGPRWLGPVGWPAQVPRPQTAPSLASEGLDQQYSIRQYRLESKAIGEAPASEAGRSSCASAASQTKR